MSKIRRKNKLKECFENFYELGMEIKKKKKTRIKEKTSITNWRFIDHMHDF